MENDYSKIKYNPFDVPMGTMIWDYYKPLGRRAHLSVVPTSLFQKENESKIPTQKDLSLLVSFVILFVDSKSPFYDEIDFGERMAICLESLHIPKDSFAYEAITTQHWWFGIVLTAYFKLANVHEFESWYTLKVHTHNQKEALRRPVEEKENLYNRNMMAGNLDDNDRKLRDMENKLFNDGTTKDIVNDTVTSDYYVGYAEAFAQTYPI